MHVVIIGYRASGKSTVAPALATYFDRELVDSDALVEMTAGSSIASLFATHGEAHFRDLEQAAIVDSLARPTTSVIATGGGCVETAALRQTLAEASAAGRARVLYLQAPDAVLAARLAHRGGGRPSLTGAAIDQEVAAVLARRRPWYEALADATVDASQPVDSVLAASRSIVENWLKTLG